MLLGNKIGMTQIYNEKGELIPVTVIEAGPCFVTQVKEASIQLGFGAQKKINKPKAGHLKELKLKHLKEFKVKNPADYKVGQEIKVDIFKPGDEIAVSGTSIGKGTMGTVRRYHFHRGPMSHGSKSHRLPGSIGAGTTPGRVEKGTRMSGRMGNVRVTQKGRKVIKIDLEKNLLLVSGSVPGPGSNLVEIYKS
ncbi:MAG: 50S ribosomal protein L3 [Candidatus Margulisiibacteriota bacterium]